MAQFTKCSKNFILSPIQFEACTNVILKIMARTEEEKCGPNWTIPFLSRFCKQYSEYGYLKYVACYEAAK